MIDSVVRLCWRRISVPASRKLVDVQIGGETLDLPDVQIRCLRATEQIEEEPEIRDFKSFEASVVGLAMDRLGRLVRHGENEFSPLLAGESCRNLQRRTKKVLLRINVVAGDDFPQKVQVVDQYHLVLLQRAHQHFVQSLFEGQWVAFRQAVEEGGHTQDDSSSILLHCTQHGGASETIGSPQNEDIPLRPVVPKTVNRPLLTWAQVRGDRGITRVSGE